MVHYPADFPFESVQFIVPLVRSGELAARKAEAVEHAWNVLGYALGKTVGHGEHQVGAVHPGEAEKVDVADPQVLEALERHAEAVDPEMHVQRGAPQPKGAKLPIPPALLASWAFKLLGLLLGK